MASNTKRLFCLNVKPLLAEKPTEPFWARGISMPLFCHVAFDDKLISEIEHFRELLVTHSLHEVSKRWESVSCFFEITESYHPNATMNIHVNELSIYFTASIYPYKEPYFKTTKLPISVVTNSSKQFKRIDIAQKSQVDQTALLRLIDIKSNELDLLWEALSNLDNLKDQILKVEASEIDFTDASLTQYQKCLQGNLAAKEQRAAELQNEIDGLCRQILWRYLSLLPGDWIYSDVGRYKNTPVQVIYESVSYQSGVIYVSGTNITQKGEVGKRQESIGIEIKAHEHNK